MFCKDFEASKCLELLKLRRTEKDVWHLLLMVTRVDLNEFQLSKEEKYHWSKGTSLSTLYTKSLFLSDNALNRGLCCDNTLDG